MGTVALLALGIAGVLTLFVPLRTIVLSPLPLPDPQRLVVVGTPVQDSYTDSFPNRASLDAVFVGIASYWATEATLSGAARPIRVAVAKVTPEFFATVGVLPWKGSDFRESPIDLPVAVVAFGAWQSWLNGAQDLSERPITLNGNRFQVLGVAPPGFDFPSGTQVWIPARAPAGGGGGQPDQTIIGRLRPDLSLGQAVDRLRTVTANTRHLPGLLKPNGPELQPLHTFLMGERRHLFWTLWIVSVLFLLLACAGVANLLWADALRRRQEMTTRSALGASRARLVRQLLAEVLLLASAGATLGLCIAVAGVRLLAAAFPWPDAAAASPVSASSILLALAAVLVATGLCGLPTALYSTGGGRPLTPVGTIGVTAVHGGQRKSRAPWMLAGGQLALAMVLLACTALLVRSLTARFELSSGFQAKDLIVFRVDLPPMEELDAARREFQRQIRANPRLDRSGVGTTTPFDEAAYRKTAGAAMRRFVARNEAWHAAAVDTLSAQPGVASVAVVMQLPFSKSGSQRSAISEIDSRTGTRTDHWISGLVRWVSGSAFQVLGIRVLAGRTFLPQDAAWSITMRSRFLGDGAMDVAIANETLARKLCVGSQKDRTPVSQNLSPSSSLLPDRASACLNRWPSV